MTNQSFLYPLPSFLAGRVTIGLYSRWLDAKALWLFKLQARGAAVAEKTER